MPIISEAMAMIVKHVGPCLLTVATLVALVCATPQTTQPGLAALSVPRTQEAADLVALVHGLDLKARPAEAVAPRPDHTVRQEVAPYAVRMAVDKNARHPLSGPVAVRQDDRLGDRGRGLRLVALAPFDPPAPAPPPASPPAPAAPAAVKKVSPPEVVATLSRPRVPIAPRPHASSPEVVPGRSVLVAGDSLSIYLADALRPMLAGRPGTAFWARGKISSGLARPDFFDWERAMSTAATSAHPDTVVIMIATNDNKTMTRPDGRKVAFGRSGWEAEYARRVRRLVELARSGNPRARVYWVGAPVMANPQLNADVAVINRVIAKELAQLPGCRFVDVWRTLADQAGHYTLSSPGGMRKIRTPDGVHLTAYGARLLAQAALSAMSPAVAELEPR